MFDVEGTEHGIRVSLGGFLDQDELKDYYEELELRVNRQSGDFHIYADHRGMKAMPDGVDEQFAGFMAMCKDGGLDQSVVVVDSAITAMQQRRLRDEAGMEGQKVVNADQNDDWKQEAQEWGGVSAPGPADCLAAHRLTGRLSPRRTP